jgi:hypothetical protein
VSHLAVRVFKYEVTSGMCSTIKPLLLSMKFVCLKCQGETDMTFIDGKYENPASCSICKGKSLQPNRQSAVTVDWQRIRLQEIVSDESRYFPYKKNPFLAFDFSHDNYSHRACESNRVEKLWLTEKRVECLEPSNVS